MASVRHLFVFAVAALHAACSSNEVTSLGPSGAGPGPSCVDKPPGGSCDGSPCGGDVVGDWRLLTFCGPECVKTAYQIISFGEDGSYNGGQGTWKYEGEDTLSVTIGMGSTT